MPLSVDVPLPRAHTPRFPERCCGCGAPHPGATYWVKHRASGWIDLVFPLLILFRIPVSHGAPACGPCIRGATRQRQVRGLVQVVCIGLAMALAFPTVRHWELSSGQRKLVLIGLVSLAIAPLVLWHVVRPPMFDFTLRGKQITYEFGSADYAYEFKALNADI